MVVKEVVRLTVVAGCPQTKLIIPQKEKSDNKANDQRHAFIFTGENMC